MPRDSSAGTRGQSSEPRSCWRLFWFWWRAGTTLGERPQVAIYQRDRQTDHIEVTAFDLLDEPRGQALNGVSARFVKGLSAGDIVLNFPRCDRREPNAGGREVRDRSIASAAAPQADSREHFVAASG